MEEKMRSSQPQQQEEKSNPSFDHVLRKALSICNAIRSKKGLICLSAVTLLLLIFFIPRYRYTVVRSGNAIYRTDNFTGKTVRICGTSIFECKKEMSSVEKERPIPSPTIKTIYIPQPSTPPKKHTPPLPSIWPLSQSAISKIACDFKSWHSGGDHFLTGNIHNGNANIHIKSIIIELCNTLSGDGLSRVYTNDLHTYSIEVDIPPYTVKKYQIKTLAYYFTSEKNDDKRFSVWSFNWKIISATGKNISLDLSKTPDFDFDSLPVITNFP
jgi:hypothetical protein